MLWKLPEQWYLIASCGIQKVLSNFSNFNQETEVKHLVELNGLSNSSLPLESIVYCVETCGREWKKWSGGLVESQ